MDLTRIVAELFKGEDAKLIEFEERKKLVKFKPAGRRRGWNTKVLVGPDALKMLIRNARLSPRKQVLAQAYSATL